MANVSGLVVDPTAADRPLATTVKTEIIGFRWLVVCIAILSSCILYGADTTIVAEI